MTLAAARQRLLSMSMSLFTRANTTTKRGVVVWNPVQQKEQSQGWAKSYVTTTTTNNNNSSNNNKSIDTNTTPGTTVTNPGNAPVLRLLRPVPVLPVQERPLLLFQLLLPPNHHCFNHRPRTFSSTALQTSEQQQKQQAELDTQQQPPVAPPVAPIKMRRSKKWHVEPAPGPVLSDEEKLEDIKERVYQATMAELLKELKKDLLSPGGTKKQQQNRIIHYYEKLLTKKASLPHPNNRFHRQFEFKYGELFLDINYKNNMNYRKPKNRDKY